MKKLSFSGKEIEAGMQDPEQIRVIAHALSSELRLSIIRILGSHSMNINEIARALDVPISTVALSMQVLEGAGLVYTEMQPGNRGVMKICSQRLSKITFNLLSLPEHVAKVEDIDMPVGGYSLFGGIQPTCGYADARQSYVMDDPAAFYHPDHLGAQILWMREGYVEYHVPSPSAPAGQLDFLEVSFEACSEAVGHKNDWPSDIYVELNGRRAGVWHCPGDFGGRRGLFTPEWWSVHNTQYGHLKTFRVNRQGTWLENDFVSGVTVEDLGIAKGDCLRLRIGVLKQGDHAGGMNLFGKQFGDYPQGIRVRYAFHS